MQDQKKEIANKTDMLGKRERLTLKNLKRIKTQLKKFNPKDAEDALNLTSLCLNFVDGGNCSIQVKI